MAAYLIKRFLLIFPTLFGIMLINFAIIQFAPGGPVDQVLSKISGNNVDSTTRIGGGSGDGIAGQANTSNTASGGNESSRYRGSAGLDPEFIKSLEKQFGLDQPTHIRFLKMLKDYATFNFGESYFRKISVLELIKEKLPVSISLGLWMTLLTYSICIPLGIRKAVKDGQPFDVWTSSILILGYALPGFLVGVFLLVVFAGGSFFQLFPLRGLTSDNWSQLSLAGKVIDYFWHLCLPVTAMALASFTTMTFLTKNSFLDEIRKQYVTTARAKGLSEKRVLYGHVFRNAMLLVIAGFPGAFIGSFFAGSILIEKIFSLEGLGFLGWNAIFDRDYPVVFATLWIFSLMGLIVHLISDFMYTLIDPRIDFESREV